MMFSQLQFSRAPQIEKKIIVNIRTGLSPLPQLKSDPWDNLLSCTYLHYEYWHMNRMSHDIL